MNRTMKTPALATVYLDNQAIGLMGDPRPRVSKILAAGGKRPEAVQVLRAASATDLRGKPVRLDDVIDRTTEPTQPIYLTCKPNPGAGGLPAGAMHLRPAEAIEFATADRAGPRPLGSPLPEEGQVPFTPPPAKPPRRVPHPSDPVEWDP